MKASEAEAVATGIARRATHLIPHIFTTLKSATMAIATASIGSPRYHCWIADAESSAVSPQ
jgi:hypothetical protein